MRPIRFIIAGCGAAALALGAAAAPAGAAPAQSAPVIHESFMLLACPKRPSTTVQIEGCVEHRVVALDRSIDALNVEVFGRLHKSGRASFIKATSEWVSYRNDSCAAQASIYSGGTIQPVAYANCLVSVDNSHLGELRTMFAALEPAG